MAETPKDTGIDIYEARKRWAVAKAKELDIEYHPDTDPDHFQIPFFDDTGKEIKREFLPVWETMPQQDTNGQKQPPISIEEAVMAIKKTRA